MYAILIYCLFKLYFNRNIPKSVFLLLRAVEKHFLNTYQQSCSGKRRLFENVFVANSIILTRHKRTTFMSISRNSSF